MDNEEKDLEELEDIATIIVLNDEDGNEVHFEFLDLIQYEGEEYVILAPAEQDEEEAEVFIFQYEEGDDPNLESYVAITDEEILDAVYAIFKEKWKDEYNFVEEE